MSERMTDFSLCEIDPAAMNAALARNWWAFVIRGVLGIGFGLITFVYPGATMRALVLAFSAYAFADGILTIVSAVRVAPRRDRWGLLIVSGLVSITAAVLGFIWPGITVLYFVLIVAFWALASGILMLAAAAELNIDHGHWWLVLCGIVSIVYSILLIAGPLTGPVVLTWWLVGAYAVVLGFGLLALGTKLRAFV